MKILILIFLISCGSIPKGKMVMKEMIEKDQFFISTPEIKNFSRRSERYLTIYAHPQVVNEDTLLKEGIFLVPVETKEKSWKEILKDKQ